MPIFYQELRPYNINTRRPCIIHSTVAVSLSRFKIHFRTLPFLIYTTDSYQLLIHRIMKFIYSAFLPTSRGDLSPQPCPRYCILDENRTLELRLNDAAFDCRCLFHYRFIYIHFHYLMDINVRLLLIRLLVLQFQLLTE